MANSLGEVKGWEKLDFQREGIEHASRIDRVLRQGGKIIAHNSSELVNTLSNGLPYIGEYCNVEGAVFLESDDFDKGGDPNVLSLDLDMDRRATARGIYGGIARIRAGNGRGGVGDRLVNVLISTEDDSVYQQHGHRIDLVRHTYFCVDGSDIRPVEPYNAHSLKDLKGDFWTQELERVVLDDRLSAKAALEGLTKVLLGMLNSRSPHTQSMNHQRLSYLNSLGFFDDKMTTSSEFLDGSVMHGDDLRTFEEIFLGYSEKPIDVVPGNVIALSGYRRPIKKWEIDKYGLFRILNQTEPYIRCYAGGEYRVTPMRLIDEIA